PLSLPFCPYSHCHHRYLLSFPTRRSSDLEALTQNGFTVEKSLVEPGPLFAAVAQGSADLYLTSWLPNTHRDYWERFGDQLDIIRDRKSTRLNSSHVSISYAVFCLKKQIIL